jgi:N-acetylglucosamine-6-phosphate deacetylase
MSLLIKNATIYTPDICYQDSALLIENGLIQSMGPSTEYDDVSAETVIDATGLSLVPGFIDLQLNGAFGDDFTANPETIWPVAAQLGQFGVTSFLPTIITSPLETIAQAQKVVLEGKPSDYRGAVPLGLHLEGPFLNALKKGAHNPIYIREPELYLVEDWSPENGVRLVTLAPEQPGALPMIACLSNRGVVLSAGHSMATFKEAQAGFEAGICYGTHLFNAMPVLGHRAPALPGALLDAQDIVVGLIPDGIHVHPALIKLIWRLKGPAGLNLVSDAMAALGMPPGKYVLNDFEVTVTEKDSRLADGTLAGSILPLDGALRNLIRYTGCTLNEGLATITTTPAKLLGIEQKRGQISPGRIADLVLLDDDLQVMRTFVEGEVIYQST